MVVKRRSLTIREENDKKIQHIRSQFLYSNIDIDYTTMVNIFIELGDMILRPGTYNMTNMTDIFKKYLGDMILRPGTYNMTNMTDIFKKYLGDIDNDIILYVLNDYKNKNVRKHE